MKLNIDENIGGPSGGLMFALGIYDVLTPGSLTDGKVIAGTGEIDAQGKVGPIGGIQQKLVGAQDDGAELFLVPADNCAEALDGNYDPDKMRLVKVSTMEQALDEVQAWVKDPDAKLTRCTAMSPVADPAGALADVVREVEAHASRAGWDQPAQLFALVETADLVEREPHLAEVLGVESPAQGLTPVEQETTSESLEELLSTHPVATRGGGCAVVLEAMTVPPDAGDVPGRCGGRRGVRRQPSAARGGPHRRRFAALR